MIRDYLKKNILITDGAMGTYYLEQAEKKEESCEIANITNPELIKAIHREYIEAGAKLIRTNTFAANRISLDVSEEYVKKIILKGYEIAKEVTQNKEIFIGASIGPVRLPADQNESVLEEYKWVVDVFLEAQVQVFVFETFSSLEHLKEITHYIKEKNKEAFIFAHFAIMPDGFTREGVSIEKIIEGAKAILDIDSYGFNCGSGPSHLYKLLQYRAISGERMAVLPNSGYPEVINERTVYPNNPYYFSEKMMAFKDLGFTILGGCCGTSPLHIKNITQSLKNPIVHKESMATQQQVLETAFPKEKNNFLDKLNKGKFVVAVELSPPFDTNVSQMLHCARVCKDQGIDLVTIPDSPMSRVRADAGVIAAKIKREIGIDAMPHICCRDKNANAIRSGLLASHIEGIRNVLAITGDPVAANNKVEAKSVFNLNSFKLMELIAQMNESSFNGDSVHVGGAINLNVRHKEIEIGRMVKKIEKGANFFLTQPIYEEEAIQALIEIKKIYPVKILGGILPIVSYRNAQFLNNELPGVHIPKEHMDKFTSDMDRETGEKVGVQIAVEMAKKMKDYVDGFYFITPFKRVEVIIEILDQIGRE